MTFGEVVKDVLGDNNGSKINLYTLTNKEGNVLKLTNYGARIVRIEVPDKDGVKDNVTTGGETLQTIIRGDAYGGASIGRFANRIANGKFTLDEVEYNLPINNRASCKTSRNGVLVVSVGRENPCRWAFRIGFVQDFDRQLAVGGSERRKLPVWRIPPLFRIHRLDPIAPKPLLYRVRIAV